jgi:hypothetical protein
MFQGHGRTSLPYHTALSHQYSLANFVMLLFLSWSSLARASLFVLKHCTILLWPWSMQFGDDYYDFALIKVLEHILSVYVQYIRMLNWMAIGVKLKNLTSDMNLQLDISTNSHCSSLMNAIHPQRNVFQWLRCVSRRRTCAERTLQEVLDSSIIDVVMYKWWVTTDRCTLETVNWGLSSIINWSFLCSWPTT